MKKKNVSIYALMLGFLLSLAACSEDKGESLEQTAAGESFICIEQIIDGCIDIATEVGETKIGDPLDKWNAGLKTEALYAVESWYSWHSREDYSNNIYSIRNAYYGSRNGEVSSVSLAALIGKNNASLDKQVREAISEANPAETTLAARKPAPLSSNVRI